jgi:hypothetical protein
VKMKCGRMLSNCLLQNNAVQQKDMRLTGGGKQEALDRKLTKEPQGEA